MKLFGRRVSPSVAFVGALALLFVVVAPLRAVTRLGDDTPDPGQTRLQDSRAASPAPRRPVPSPARSRETSDRSADRTGSTGSDAAADDRSPSQILDDALARKRRSDAQSDRDTADRSGTRWDPLQPSNGQTRPRNGTSGTSGTDDKARDDEQAPERLGRAVGDLLDLLGGGRP